MINSYKVGPFAATSYIQTLDKVWTHLSLSPYLPLSFSIDKQKMDCLSNKLIKPKVEWKGVEKNV